MTVDLEHLSTLLNLRPSAWVMLFFLTLGVLYVISLLLKNTAITEAIAKAMTANTTKDDAMVASISEIRQDQLVSNAERKEHGKKIDDIDNRLTSLEFDVLGLTRGQRTRKGDVTDD